MSAFWIAAALFTALALWFIVRPLARRRESAGGPRDALNVTVYGDQARELEADLENGLLSDAQYEDARRELEARLLEDVSVVDAPEKPSRAARHSAYALAALLPIGAFAVYLAVGTPAALDAELMARSGAPHIDPREFEGMVAKLAERLKQEPENVEGWEMLAKSYRHLGRFEDAAKAYASLVSRVEADAGLLADYADALAMAQGQRLSGEPEKLVARALELDPKHLKALALAGTAAFEKKDYAGAVGYWQRMLPLVPAGSEEARAIASSIEEAGGLGKIAAAGAASDAAPKRDASAAAHPGVSGIVRLAPEVAAKVAPTDTVFIYARAAQGSRMPLAIVRKEARDLPVSFTLDDTMAMAPNVRLSNQEEIVIAARVSKSSSAAPRPGDFEGLAGPVRNDANGVIVVIDTEIR